MTSFNDLLEMFDIQAIVHHIPSLLYKDALFFAQLSMISFAVIYNRIMSALACSISGAPLSAAVVSSKTGHLYEKSTILHYLSLHANCPHTGQPLTPQDLVDITPSNTILLPSQQTVPALVQKLQGELDALILETHMLKQNLRERREELAVSLYRQDASIRVIAKLKDERDQNREKIAVLMQEIRDRENK